MILTAIYLVKNNKLIAGEQKICDTILSKALGLMFSTREAVKNRGLIFTFNSPMYQSMHMYFVFYPIDILFLDDHQCVIELVENFKPFTFYNSRQKAKFVVELSNGSIKKNRITVGDLIEWE